MRTNTMRLAVGMLAVCAGVLWQAGCATGAAATGTQPSYLAVAPFDAAQARKFQETWAKRLNIPVEVTNSIGMRFVLIPPGEFVMGSPTNELMRDPDEYQHTVRITRPFYLGMFPVTQGEYKYMMEENPSYWSPWGYKQKRGKDVDTSRYPVERVAWDQALDFCQRVADLQKEKAAGRIYRLATEAEWEYACRAGTTTTFYFGNSINGTQANMLGTQPYGTDKKGPYLNRPTDVGSYAPNPFGLHDMLGNVWEWCNDIYESEYYTNSPIENPTGPAEGKMRVMRGGGWRYHAKWTRPAVRHGYPINVRAYDLGFRVAISIPGPWRP